LNPIVNVNGQMMGRMNEIRESNEEVRATKIEMRHPQETFGMWVKSDDYRGTVADLILIHAITALLLAVQ
jgi:hypothetical protein